jgi:hypothetical protein
MTITRREFTRNTLLVGATSAIRISPSVAEAPISAQQLIDKITSAMGPAWNPTSYRDTIKMGDPNTRVNGVASCFMSTFDVIKRAHAKGLNFVLTHEPTMWTDADLLPGVQNDPLFKLKLEFVNDNKMIVWRSHDSMHKMQPEPMRTGELQKLGWGKFTSAEDQRTYHFSPGLTLSDAVRQFSEKIPTGSLRIIGDPNLVANTATHCGHSCAATVEGLEKYDVAFANEAREWETAEYGRDVIAAGGKKAVIVTAHESGEENGVHFFTSWFQQRFPTIHIEFIPTGDRLWTL